MIVNCEVAMMALRSTNFPRVSSTSRRPAIGSSLPGPRAAEILARDSRVFSTSTTRVYPLVIASGEGLWVTDVDGNQFLDFTAGIAVTSTGHAHPAVVEAIQSQTQQFLHMAGTDFYYEVAVKLAERLARLAPVGPGDARVFLCNSGTEAIEGAMKLARWSTGRPNFLAFFGAFHGRTMGSLSLTASTAVQRDHLVPLLSTAYHVPYPAMGDPTRTTGQTFRRIEEIFDAIAPPESFAAVFVEPIQGEGGYIVPPDDFLPRLRELTREHGILLVTDEIQSGMGRTGRMFAAEHCGVQSDIVAVGKGIASGLPLGGFIARSDVMSWPPGTHGTTFGGNPVACAAALATLDLLEGGLVDNAAEMGRDLLSGLQKLKGRYSDLVNDVRGRGLMVALEMATPELRDSMVQKAFQRGLLVLPAGKQAVRFSPALTVSEQEIDVALEILDRCLADLRP